MRRLSQLILNGGWFRSTLSAMTDRTASCIKPGSALDTVSSVCRAPASSGVTLSAAASCPSQGRDRSCMPVNTVATACAPTQRPSPTPAAALQPSFSVQQLPCYSAPGGSVRSFAASASPSGNRCGSDPISEMVDTNEAARRVMEDPMARLMASQGMPVGLSLRAEDIGGGGAGGGRAAARERSELADTDGGAPDEDPSRPPRAEPAYQMEAFSDMLRATAAAARRGSGSGAWEDGSSCGGGEGDARFTAGVQRVGPSLDDSWGTTRESPADIARRIVESNLEVERDCGGAVDDDDDGPDGPLALSPSEQKYASLEAMSAEIKKLDEVFEVLASVPWLDEDVLSEKELKGMAQVGLLGTLEEVGFNIRPQLLRIWSGERGAELAAGPDLGFRDQAALMAVLYHTQQIEEAHGPPPRGYLTAPKEGSGREGSPRK